MNVSRGALVELGFRLYDERGELLESSAEDGPLTYHHGAGEIFPALEEALEGAPIGAKRRVTLAPENAFGAYDPAAIVSVPRAELPPDAELEEGEFLSVKISEDEGESPREDDVEEDDDDEDELELLILEVSADEVILDANHPLAGHEVTFELEVLSVRPGGDTT